MKKYTENDILRMLNTNSEQEAPLLAPKMTFNEAEMTYNIPLTSEQETPLIAPKMDFTGQSDPVDNNLIIDNSEQETPLIAPKMTFSK